MKKVSGVALLLIVVGLGFNVWVRWGHVQTERTLPKGTSIMHAEEITLTSSAFTQGGPIPARYTCDDTHPAAEGISPPLTIGPVPAGTKSLALIMHDPDAPMKEGWTHWVKWNIPQDTKVIREGEEPAGISGKGSGGELTYKGPCPPEGTHRYFFMVYALDTELSLASGSNKTELEWAMQGHTIGKGELVGLYSRGQKE